MLKVGLQGPRYSNSVINQSKWCYSPNSTLAFPSFLLEPSLLTVIQLPIPSNGSHPSRQCHPIYSQIYPRIFHLQRLHCSLLSRIIIIKLCSLNTHFKSLFVLSLPTPFLLIGQHFLCNTYLSNYLNLSVAFCDEVQVSNPHRKVG